MMDFFNTILLSYGWQGLALIALVVTLLIIQIFYYSFRFRRLGTYLNKSRMLIHETPPPVSLVIPMFSEDRGYLDEILPSLLSQKSVEYEVVVVYVGCDSDFYDDMLYLKEVLPNFSATKIERNDRFPISVKTALNIGIKAAKYEHIVFTTTDAHPVSENWLWLMSRGFQRGNVVLGYCGVETSDNKFDSFFIRATRLYDSMVWLSRAIAGKPYRGIRSNMGFTKSLYFDNRGFNCLNMNIGEDDLFLQKIMTSSNTSVILSPRAMVLQRNWGRMDGLVDTMKYYGSAAKFYPIAARNYISWEMTSRVLYILLSIVGVIFLPLELKAAIILLALIRLWVVLSSVNQVAKRVGETKIVGRYLFYDLLSPIFRLFMRLVMVKRDDRVWR
ncbi:MAG: glycosyltransferase family 2 protein [Rikenellaceae bacterium]